MQPLSDLFSTLQDRRVLFVRPGGNWGDYLIYRGAEVLAKRHQVRFITLDYEEFATGPAWHADAVYIHGGGGFNSWTSGRASKAFAHGLANYPCKIIQGPVTIAEDRAYQLRLADLMIPLARNRDVHIYARELLSYQALIRVFSESDVNIHLDEDTAFHATRAELSATGSFTSRYHLNALREDNERSGLEAVIQRSNRCITLDPATYARSFDHWVRIHAESGSIRTNRTHSAIVGAILGIPTTMFASSYHKNRSIWEYSLQDRGVAWAEYECADDSLQASSSHHPPPFSDFEKHHWLQVAKLRHLVRPWYRVVNLPRLRARASSRLKLAGKWLQRVDNTRRGLPWK